MVAKKVTTDRSVVVGVFNNREQAQQAVKELRRFGFREDQIGFAGRDEAATGTDATEAKGSHAGEGAVAGVAAGAGLGALWGLGILSGFIPAIGPAIAGGILGTLLSSAAAGAAVAGLTGALIGMGIPEEDAAYYDTEFKSGKIIATVKADGRYDEAWDILHRYGAYNRDTMDASQATSAVHGTSASHTTAATTGVPNRTAGGTSMRLHEEQLDVNKRPVEAGEVKVRKEVVTEKKTVEVPVQREEVVIQRHPATGRASSADIRPGEEIRIPVSEEQVDVQKRTVATEEVNVGKRKVQDTERVSADVRKEQVKVEREGNPDVCDTGANADKQHRTTRK